MTHFANVLRRPHALLIIALMLATLPIAARAAGCSAPQYRQFDFFVGHWNVYDPHGDLVGTDVVETELRGCVVSERFTGNDGGVGIGLSGYQYPTRTWYQDFMGDHGLLVTLRGRPSGSAAMVLNGDDYIHGKHRLDRGVWTVRGNEVEELWTGSTDGGKTWTTIFDGFFRRQ
jgi:hypothetical protein